LPDTISPDTVYSDTVIVGGGIAGLYACNKLKQLKGAGHTIPLFESSNRFGGRIETVEMGGFEIHACRSFPGDCLPE